MFQNSSAVFMDYAAIIEDIFRETQPLAGVGRQADYIPELAKVDPDRFGMCIHTLGGDVFAKGDAGQPFSIQSISKVFSLAVCLSLEGEDMWRRVGMEPSGSAFNSVIQLELERGIPRNPFINAGALVVADILLTHLDAPEERYLDFVRRISANDTVDYNRRVASSERETGFLNAAIVNLLKYYGNIENDIERVLEFYFLLCSVEMSCVDLARAFLPFADHRRPFEFGDVRLTSSQVKRMNAIMQTCGFYNEAGVFSYLVGLPGKSGVGGGIAAIYPMRYSAAVWSPRLNDKGNSVMGIKALELLTTKTQESIF